MAERGGHAEAESDGEDYDQVAIYLQAQTAVWAVDIKHLEEPGSADYLDVSQLLSQRVQCPFMTSTATFCVNLLVVFYGWPLTGRLSELQNLLAFITCSMLGINYFLCFDTLDLV